MAAESSALRSGDAPRKPRLSLVVGGLVLSVTMNHRSSGGEGNSASEHRRGSRITFLSHRTGHNVLYKMRPNASELTPVFGGELRGVPTIVNEVKLYREPHWTRQSPNGRYFASWVYDQGIPYEKWQGDPRAMLHVGGLDAAWSRVLNPDCHEEFAWSPDSTRIAFTVFSERRGYFESKLPSSKIMVAGMDGSNQECLLEKPGLWMVCDWSPDGKRLLLRKDVYGEQPNDVNDLVEFDLAAELAARTRSKQGPSLRSNEWPATAAPGFLKRLLPRSAKIDPNEARYSPDGKELAIDYVEPAKRYAPNECAEGLGRLNMMRCLGRIGILAIATGQTKTITDYPDGLRGPICWSPDGNEVLFSRYLPKGDDRERMGHEHGLAIWAIGKDGRHARFVTTGWSPDWR